MKKIIICTLFSIALHAMELPRELTDEEKNTIINWTFLVKSNECKSNGLEQNDSNQTVLQEGQYAKIEVYCVETLNVQSLPLNTYYIPLKDYESFNFYNGVEKNLLDYYKSSLPYNGVVKKSIHVIEQGSRYERDDFLFTHYKEGSDRQDRKNCYKNCRKYSCLTLACIAIASQAIPLIVNLFTT